MSDFSTILFARPSFSEGMARIVDFGNTLSEYNRSPTGSQADSLAIRADWRAIGADLEEAEHGMCDEAGLLILEGGKVVKKIQAK